MTDHPYDDPTSQAARRHALENDRKLRERGSTYLGFTHSDIGGRFGATDVGKETVIGRDAPNYPAGPNWTAADPVGQEPPLNQDLNFVEPCGTPAEIERSIEQLGEAGVSPGPPDGGAAVAPALVSPPLDAAEPAAPSTSKKQRSNRRAKGAIK